uniref:Guanylate kinase/L-type calcium channel beta subunit domain-containing protein n=1 Tax=Parascaris univalens TaxID=6257 RepID=A0A915BQ42_PARUN
MQSVPPRYSSKEQSINLSRLRFARTSSSMVRLMTIHLFTVVQSPSKSKISYISRRCRFSSLFLSLISLLVFQFQSYNFDDACENKQLFLHKTVSYIHCRLLVMICQRRLLSNF